MMKLDGNGKDTRREEGIFLVNIDSLPDDEKCLIFSRRSNLVIKIITIFSLLTFVAHLNAELNEKNQKILQKQSCHTYSPSSCAHHSKVSENV